MATRTTPAVLAALQAQLNAELQAQHQYQAAESICRHLGYGKRAGHYATLYAKEAEHAQEIEERILFLGGVPDVNRAALTPPMAVNPAALLAVDHQGEETAAAGYRDLAVLCLAEGDPGTLTLAQHLLAEEEEHLISVEADQTQVEQMGGQNWLSLQV
jgi:bacterioferritin